MVNVGCPKTKLPDYNMRTIVAIAGRIGAGKDAAADALQQTMAFMNVKLSDPLKHAASVMFGIPHECFCDNNLKDVPNQGLRGSTPRAVLQWLGTDVMQHGLMTSGLVPGIGCSFWACRLADTIDSMPSSKDRIVISDMRFQHELDFLRKRYGDQLFTIRIVRSGLSVVAEHESERSVDSLDIDLVIHNDSTLLDLHQKVLDVVKVHMEHQRMTDIEL